MQSLNRVQRHWILGRTERVGRDPNHSLEVEGLLGATADKSNVIVGVGGRIAGNNFTTLELQIAPILADGRIGQAQARRYGRDINHTLEASGRVRPQEVVVGLGMRAASGNLTTLVLYARTLNPETGLLGADLFTYKFGRDPDHSLEVQWHSANSSPAFDRTIITGVGVRVANDNITTLVLHTGTLS